MKTIKNKEEFNIAIQHKEETISVEDAELAKTLILAYRIQNGYIPDVVVDRVMSGNSCKIAVGEGVVVNVDATLMQQADALRREFDNLDIEIDVTNVIDPLISFYYGKCVKTNL